MVKSSNSIATGIALADKRFKNELSTPNLHDEDAALFSDIGKIFGEKPKGMNALFAGVAKGAAHGASTKSTQKKQDALSSFDKVSNYYEKMNHYATERNNWYEKHDFARQKYLPQVLTYAQNVTRYDPQTRQMALQGILDGYNETMGEDYRLKSIDGANPFILTIEGKKGIQVMDIRNLFDSDQNAQARFNQQMPEVLMQNQEKREKEAQKMAMLQDTLEINKHKAGLPSKFSPEGGKNNTGINVDEEGNSYIPLDKLEKSARADFQKQVTKQLQSIPVNENSINTIKDMRNIFEKFPDIGSKFVNLLDNEDNEGSWSNLLGRMTLSTKEIAAMEKLKKSASDLNLSTVLGIPGKSATDLLKRSIKSAAPHGKLTKEAFDSIAKNWEERAKYNIYLAEKGLEDLGNNRITNRKRIKENQSSVQEIMEDDIDLSDLGGKPSNAGTF